MTTENPKKSINLVELAASQPAALQFAEVVRQALTNFQSSWVNIKPNLDNLVLKAQPLLEGLIKIDWKRVAETIDRLPARSKEAMIIASKRGWFLGWHGSLGDLVRLLDALETGDGAPIDPQRVDQVMEQYFEENFSALTEELVKTYPHRAAAIEAAAFAHGTDLTDGAYLSVPVFIAQADGLLAEVLGTKSLFQKVGRDKITSLINEMSLIDPTVSELMAPLLIFSDLELIAGETERANRSAQLGKKFNALNRHQVMHGEVSDYGTKQNSLRAFSLLCFVGLHVPQVAARPEKKLAAAK